MKYDRDARRCALQVMYQFDAGAVDDLDVIRETLDGSGVSEPAREKGFALATLAWEFRDESDEIILGLSPEWPINRQPMVDRNLLRLAFYEIRRGGTPPRAAINEAVELAKVCGDAFP